MTYVSPTLNIKTLFICSSACIWVARTMSVPQAMFVARKVRENERKIQHQDTIQEFAPTKYSSKYMNSIWGMYNRYSVHNFKKNMDAKIFSFPGQQEPVVLKTTAEKPVDFKGNVVASAQNLLPQANYM